MKETRTRKEDKARDVKQANKKNTNEKDRETETSQRKGERERIDFNSGCK